jgi:hypothetical protein
MTDPNSPTYASPAAEALAHLRVAEGADRDILDGRDPMDAAQEQAAAIRLAIAVLEAPWVPIMAEPQPEPATDREAIDWAMTYARTYWTFGKEPETQRALTILSRALATGLPAGEQHHERAGRHRIPPAGC